MLIYSQDGNGLGHLRRTHNIAKEIMRQAPDSEVLVLADSPVAPFFADVTGVRYRKLPTLVKVGDAAWQSGNGSSSVFGLLGRRSELIRSAVREFRPHAILVDHMPVGALGELRPMLHDTLAMDRRPKLILGLRDILDRPATIRRSWKEVDAYALLQLYDKVIIYGCREVFDADESYGLSQHARDVSYIHYVVSESDPGNGESPLTEPYVLVMGGGGADAYPLADAFLDAWPRFSDRGLRACILTGPNMDPEERSRLIVRAGSLGVRVPGRKVEALPWIRRAEAVVTMAGYNSLSEVLRWRRPALVVPRSGPSAEQRMRAERFERLRITAVLDPDELSPDSLARELDALLRAKRVPSSRNIPRLDGASRAARAILSTLNPPVLRAEIPASPSVGEGDGARATP